MLNIINAFVPNKKEKGEKSTVELELHFSLYFDGLPLDGAQENIRNAFRKGIKTSSLYSNNPNIYYTVCENPNAIHPSNRDLENSLIKHFAISVSLTPYNTIKNQYINQLLKIKTNLESEVNTYIVDSNVESIKIYFYLIGYNQGEFISNIINSIGIYDDDNKLIDILKKFFSFKNFLSNKKIKTKIVESVTMMEPAGLIDKFINNGFVKLITGRSDLLYEGEDEKDGEDYPSEENISIYDAVLMCQHTYESESPADKSIFSIIHSFFSKKENKASEDGEIISIKVDDDILSNIKNNKALNDLNSNWIRTDAEWRTVPNQENGVLEETKIGLNSRISGFYSKLYARVENNQTKSYAYCTAGTEPLSFNDWFFANFLQGLTGISLQYTQSVRNAIKLDKYCQRKRLPLFFVGHSLGGGLASNNALATSNRHAITFNAAGLNPFRIMATLLINNPKDFFNRTGRKNRVHPFIIDGEAVQLLRYIGQPAMSADKNREMRYSNDTEIINSKINKKDNGFPKFEDMGIVEKHNVLNFLRIKDLSLLKINS